MMQIGYHLRFQRCGNQIHFKIRKQQTQTQSIHYIYYTNLVRFYKPLETYLRSEPFYMENKLLLSLLQPRMNESQFKSNAHEASWNG